VTTRRRGSRVWLFVVTLVIVLLATGVAEKIITALSHVFQGM
jgi:hypothetical protein